MIRVLDTLLAPLARLLVARGVLFADFVERMKGHYVQAAMDQAEGKVTDSRLSVMTGLQRRDIARLKEFEAKSPRPNHLVRLVALWQTEPDYQGVLDLPRNGPAPSFEALAREVRRDVHPRTMLDTLEASGTVAVDHARQSVRLLKTSYQPLAGSEDQLLYLTRNLGDHLSAATDNVLGAEPPHFERATHYSGLTEDQVAELEAEYRTAQMALLEALSRRAADMKKGPEKGTRGFRAGGYFYQANEGAP